MPGCVDFVVNCHDDQSGIQYEVEVSKRPGMEEFLSWLCDEGYRVSLYTAGQRYYTEAILSEIDPDKKIFSSVKCQNDCVSTSLPGVFLKDIVRFARGHDNKETFLRRAVLIDNNPVSHLMRPNNGTFSFLNQSK